jgi:hypothetical protein
MEQIRQHGGQHYLKPVVAGTVLLPFLFSKFTEPAGNVTINLF